MIARHNVSKLSPLALAVIVATPALAQESSPPMLEEVLVTATKREASIQEVPLSIAAFTSEDLQKIGAVEFADYATAVPNLSFGYAGEGRQTSRRFQIRGIFGGGTSALYINDTPVPVTMDPRVLDVERVEVLRGPQGSLFGARSMGGLVRLVTKQPDFQEFSGSVHGRVGTVAEGGEEYLLDGQVNIPLADGRGGLRLSAYTITDSGFIDRMVDPDASMVLAGIASGDEFEVDDINEDDTVGFQASLGFQLTDALYINPGFIYQKYESDGPAFVDNDIDNLTKVRQFNLTETGEDEYYLASLDLEYELEAGTLVSSTSFFNRETYDLEDGTQAISFLGLGGEAVRTIEVADSDRFTQELRFSSDFDGPVQVLAGLFYQKIEVDGGFPPESIIPVGSAFDLFFGVGGLSFFSLESTRETEEMGLFGELTYDISPELSVIVGGRWFDFENEESRADGGILFELFGPGAISSGTFSQSEDGFNPRLGLQWNPTDEVNVFVNAAQGFRPGGVNTGATACAALGVAGVPTTFDSDSLWSYEIGAKTSWADNRVVVNATAFFMQWDDYRAGTIQCGLGFGASENTGEAESQGFELDLIVTPASGFTISAGIGFTDAEITDAGNAVGLVEGEPLPNVPELTGVIALDHNFSLSDSKDAFWRLDYRYVDDSLSPSGLERPSYDLLNFRVGVTMGQLELSLLLENATDERANLADPTELSDALNLLAINRPRTASFDVRYHF